MLARIIDAGGFIFGSALFVCVSLLPFAEKVREHKKEMTVLLCVLLALGGAVFSALSYAFNGVLPCLAFTFIILIAFLLLKFRILSLNYKRTYWVECIAIAGTALFQAESIGVSRLIFGYDNSGCFRAGYFAAAVPLAVICFMALIELIKRTNSVVSRYPSVCALPAFNAFAVTMCALTVAGAIALLLDTSVYACINGFITFVMLYFVFLLWCAYYGKMSLAKSAAARNEQLERIIEIQKKQYQEINEQIAKTKTACHDLRQHMFAIKQLVSNREYEKLCEYLTAYGKSLPDGFGECKCGNAAVDSIVRYYSAIAADKGISTDFKLQTLYDNNGVSTPDLCIVFGNALENAVEAAVGAAQDMRFIRVRCENNENWITIVIGNGFSAAPREVNGVFMSSKQEGRVGIGTESIRAVAEKYNGSASFETMDNLFKTSVIMFK